MTSATTVLGRTAIGLGIAVGIYGVILGAFLTIPLQRGALYLHKFNTALWHDLDDATQFGFAKGQVTPFNIRTPDGQILYAWHVLPLDTYARNEAALRAYERPDGPVESFTDTLAFRLLSSRLSNARVIINFHGNVGNVGQGWRTDSYRNLATQPNTHVVSVDYRGFGLSSGSPTEAGLIRDGTALVNWVMNTAKITPDRIVILGHSLGTAVASAVALNFANPQSDLITRALVLGDREPLTSVTSDVAGPTAFAGIVLVAPFSSVPSLLLTYRMGGFISILLPLRPFPGFASYLTAKIEDKWPTAARLSAYNDALAASPRLLQSTQDDLAGDGISITREMGAVQIIHARSDRDISYKQTEMICTQVLGNRATSAVEHKEVGTRVIDVKDRGRPRFRFEILEHGGMLELGMIRIVVLLFEEATFADDDQGTID